MEPPGRKLCPQRNSKVSSLRSRYIATKSLSTRHIIAQQGSYDNDITLQIVDTDVVVYYVYGVYAVHQIDFEIFRSIERFIKISSGHSLSN